MFRTDNLDFQCKSNNNCKCASLSFGKKLLIQEIDLGVPYGDPKNHYYNISKTKKSPKIYVDITI